VVLFFHRPEKRPDEGLERLNDRYFAQEPPRGSGPRRARLVHATDTMSVLVLILALLVAPEDLPKSAAASSATAPKAAPAVSSKTIVGEIVWVDIASRLVLVRESVKSTAVKGKPAVRETVAIAIAPDVPVIRGKKASTLAELKPKDHVVARYVPTAEGAKAVSVRVADAAPPGSPAGGPPDGGETD
jgi:hypothetical protein